MVEDHAARSSAPLHRGHEHHDDKMPMMDEAFWEAHYGSAAAIWSGRPNPHLVTEVDGLVPGRALEVGAGEGADAIWLAQQGWQVDAIDISRVALARGQAQADALGPDIAERITWTRTDLLVDAPQPSAYDLVSVHFMQLLPDDRTKVLRGCVDAVAPGGTLLIVAHHPKDMATTMGRPHLPDLYYTAEDVAQTLDPAWTVLAQDMRPRGATNPHGDTVTIYDTVLLARRVGSDDSPV